MGLTSADVSDVIRRFVAVEAGIHDESIIPDDRDLFAEGILDSLMTVSLVTFCENQFGCEIGADDFSEEATRTIRGLAALVYSRTQARTTQ